MNTFLVVLCLAVAACASHVHHIPSGHISVGKNGAVIAGPAGSVHTDNGLHGHAGARLSGPAGEVRTKGGHAELDGPGIGHHGGWGGDDGGNGGGNGGGWGGDGGHGHGHVHIVPVVHHHVVPVAIAHGHHGISHGLIGHGAIGHGLIGHGGW